MTWKEARLKVNGETMTIADLRLDVFGLLSTVLVLIFTIVCKFILKLGEEYEKPKIFISQKGKTSKSVLERCKKLKESYKPTTVWGRNGHIQTVIHAAFGRAFKPTFMKSRLHTLIAQDGATISYNFFSCNDNVESSKLGRNSIVLIVPGIANSSRTTYVQAFAAVLQDNGYDVAAFNHLGAHPVVKLTAPRLFTYGCTSDLHLVVKDLVQRFPRRKLIGIGFSMGGNVLLKYLGEQPIRQKFFSFALSICQGYDVSKASPLFMEWRGFRRFYNWMITRNYKKLITQRHRKSFLDFERKGSFEKLDWRRISSASSLQELDNTVIRRFASFNDVENFYKWCSSSNYMRELRIPLLLLNAMDDPLVPEPLFDFPKKLVDEHSEVVFVVTKHGGHLGFFEGGFICPDKDTWLDRALLEYVLSMDEEMTSSRLGEDVEEHIPLEKISFAI